MHAVRLEPELTLALIRIAARDKERAKLEQEKRAIEQEKQAQTQLWRASRQCLADIYVRVDPAVLLKGVAPPQPNVCPVQEHCLYQVPTFYIDHHP